MKKILSFLTAGLLALTMFSCSTDLHDVQPIKHEPVTIAGAKWYYYDLTVFGDNAGKAKFIVNNNGKDVQTVDTTLGDFSAKNGGALYYTVDATAATKTLACNISYQNDNPSYTAVPGVLRIYVYSNITEPTLHIWDNDDAFKGTSWPGYSFTENGKTVESTYDTEMTISTISVTGLPASLNGKKVYFTGDFNSWVTPGETGSIEATVTNGEITLTSQSIKMEAKSVKVGEVGASNAKFAASGWSVPEVCGYGAGGKAANASIKVIKGCTKIRGIFKAVASDDAEKYTCDWYVE